MFNKSTRALAVGVLAIGLGSSACGNDLSLQPQSAITSGNIFSDPAAYQQFLANLQSAIEQQAELVSAMQHQLGLAQQSLAGERRKVDSYGVLDHRQQALASSRDQRRQQAIHDELATKSFLKRAAGGDD